MEGLKTGKTNNEVPGDSQPPMQGATPRCSPKIKKSLETDDLEAFPFTETMDTQGTVWRTYVNFEFKLIKELKLDVAQYRTTAPYSTAIVESVAENCFMPGDW